MASVLHEHITDSICISFRDSSDTHMALRRRSRQLGMTPGEFMREILHSSLDAGKKCAQSLPEDPLLSLLKAAYRQTYLALQDGVLSPVERETITDHIAEVLHQVRTRRTA